MPAHPAADRNLLFGVLALQMDFINQGALVAAMQAWIFCKDKPLGQILVEQGILGADRRTLLEALVQEHLKQHGDDTEKSLAAISSVGSVRQDLERIADADVQASLATIPPVGKDDPYATLNAPGVSGTDPYATQYTSVPPAGAPLRYRILRPHAKGGLGEVFVARDEELHREVALKAIQGRHADHPESRSRFVLEAEITGSLEHPGIVPVYGLGTYADGRPYYAMRFIKGDSLKDAIERFHKADVADRDPGERTLALRQLLRRFMDVCNAIAYAHSRGVLHRDLKPGNIMLGQYGETLVVDWGLAKPLGHRPEKTGDVERTLLPHSGSGSADTEMGSAVGTPGFMSPEQAAGRLNELGPTSDVYSLGATLYCLLTGKQPVDEPNIWAVLARVQLGEFPRPRQVKPSVPAALEAVCLKAMALKPADRYTSPREVADDIEQWLADEPVSAWQEPWSMRARRWLARHRTLVTTAAASIVVACAGLLIGLVLLAAAHERESHARRQETIARQQETLAREDAQQNQLLAERKEREAQEQRADALQTLYFSRMQLAKSAWDVANVGHTRELVEAYAQPPKELDKELRGFEWQYLWHVSHADLRTLTGHEKPVVGVCFSPDGRRLASASQDQTVKVWDVQTGREILTLKGHTGMVHGVAFSPDGQRLASASEDSAIKVWNLQTGKEILQLSGHAQDVWSVAFSPDGRRLASASADQTVKIWDAETGKEERTLRGHTGAVNSVCFSPDGRRLASASADATIRIWDPQTGDQIASLKGHTYEIFSVCFSPDGQRLASCSRDWTVRLWDAQTSQLLRTLTGHTNWVRCVSFSPDGQRLASSGTDQTVKVWDLQTGRPLFTLKGHADFVFGVAFSPDGQRLASASHDGTVRIWDARVDPEVTTLTGHTNYVNSVCFSPDGQRLASGGDRTVKTWDVRTGQLILSINGHTDWVRSVCFSTDGKRLASAANDHTAKIWDAQTGKEVYTLQGHSNRVLGVCFSPDGRRLASASDDQTVKVWDLESGREAFTIQGHTGSVRGICFSPNGQLLASASEDKTVKLWDAQTGREVRTLQGHTSAVYSVCFSPDGKSLASTSNDRTVKLWNPDTGEAFRTFHGHFNSVVGVCFSPDGRRLASCAYDQTVKVWDTQAGHEAITLQVTGTGLLSLAFSPDGRRLAGSSQARTVKVWDARTGPEVEAEREAVVLVRTLMDGSLARDDVIQKLQAAPAVGPVREQALALVEHYQAADFLQRGTTARTARRWDEARQEYRIAIALDPRNAISHNGLGFVLESQGRAKEATTEYQTAVALDPQYTVPHNNLGWLLQKQGRLEQAKAEFHKALDLDPNYPNSRRGLATILSQQGRFEEAIDESRQLLARPPATAGDQGILAAALQRLGRKEEAVREYRKAIELNPNLASLHVDVGNVLMDQGKLDEAVAEYQKAVDKGNSAAAARLRQAEQLVALRKRLPAVIRGDDHPANASEQLAFASLCGEDSEKLYAAAVRFYAAAFAANPRMGEDSNQGSHFPAARAAVLASSGQGHDADKLDAQEKTRLRTQALAWLKADLASNEKRAASTKLQDRCAVQQTLRSWQKHVDLSTVRTPDGLAALPQAEREAWKHFWQSVDAVLVRAAAND